MHCCWISVYSSVLSELFNSWVVGPSASVSLPWKVRLQWVLVENFAEEILRLVAGEVVAPVQ